MGSHSLLIVLERLTMHLSWISIVFQVLVFQIITTQIYGKHTSNYRANLKQDGASASVQGRFEMVGLDQNRQLRKKRAINTKPGTVVGTFEGQEKIGGFGENWRSGRSFARTVTLTEAQVTEILHKAVCGKIEKKDSVQDGTCVLQLLDYNQASGEAHYVVHFTILDQDKVEDDVHDVHNNIKDHIQETSAGNPDLAAILATVKKGPISTPTTSGNPCPGDQALTDDGTCPAFGCTAGTCKNSGECGAEGKCACVGGFKGLDCALFECTDNNPGTDTNDGKDSSCDNKGTCDPVTGCAANGLLSDGTPCTRKCTCDPGFTGVNCMIECDVGKVPKADKTGCEKCGAGEAVKADKTACEACGSGQVPNTAGTECECESGKVPNTAGTECMPCGAGEVPNTAGTECECESGMVLNTDGTECMPCGAKGLVQGTITIGGTGTFRRRKNWAIFGKDDVKNILKEAFCDNIISGSIVTGSCDLQVLDYNIATGLAKYILSFEILDATELEKSLYIINKDIATNTAVTASGLSALPGTIVGASELVQGHLEVVGLNRRPRNNHI